MPSITSTANPHVAALRALHTGKGRSEAGMFLVEGPHLITAALDAHLVPEPLLYDADALARTPAGRDLMGRLEALRAGGARIYDAAPAAIARACDTQAPQGVVAAIPIAGVAADTVRQRRRGRARALVLILDAVSDPGNVGTLLRAALAADVDEVWLSPGCADPLAPKVVRAASGATFIQPVRAPLPWDEVAARLAGAPHVHQVVLAEATARDAYDELDLTQRTALIVCNEAHGPTREAARLATRRVRIPMWNKVESLNAAIAGSVILFEGGRQRRAHDLATQRTDQSPSRTPAPRERVTDESAQGGEATD
ncbi:MAG TPA: RNA methyltransferase [Ktedonobacterales bacterium]|jgi:TrmH family RNA methyltransferase